MLFHNIPLEIQNYPQWVNWKYEQIDGKQTKIPLNPRNGHRASVTDPRDWGTFAEACTTASYCDGIGFVFTKSDPFCGADFDGGKDANSHRNLPYPTIERLDSYTEASPSGRGYHCIVKAVLPGKGKRRNGVELYDNERYFTFTGNVVRSLPIEFRQEIVNELYASLGPAETIQIAAGLEEPTLEDDDIISRAQSARNGEKFNRLWDGNWQEDYASQSEADFSLINILCFYSRNSEQVVRLFRRSGLGQRAKAQRGSYVGLMVRRSFDRQPPTVMLAGGSRPWFDATVIEPWQTRYTAPDAFYAPFVPPTPIGLPDAAASLPSPAKTGLPVIPGLVGDLVAHCWHSAPYQVPEVALCSALTTMSLLAGRTYRIGTNGLTLYMLVLAKTSTGKSFGYAAQHKLRDTLINSLRDPTAGPQYKERAEFIRSMFIREVGSAPGLSQHIIEYPSTLFQADEFTKTIRRIVQPNASPNDQALHKELLALTDFAKPGMSYIENVYSNRSQGGGKRKPPGHVFTPCLTVFGTGTPAEFYDNLTPAILNEGLIPRFTIMEYEGLMPDEHIPDTTVSQSLYQQLMYHVNKCFLQNQNSTGAISDQINIEFDAHAKQAADDWKKLCRVQIKNAQMENLSTIGLWSRAMSRVEQIAGLIAVGVNPAMPIATAEYVAIAREIIQNSVHKLVGKIVRGEVDSGDVRLEAEIKRCIARIQNEGYHFLKSIYVSKEIAETDAIPISAIRWYCVRLSAFNRHKMGANRAFDDALKGMIDSAQMRKIEFKYGTNNKTWAVIPIY